MSTKRKLPHINSCEVCGLDEPSALERHHIIPRTDPECTNYESNLAVVCGSCHNLIHAHAIIIEGRYMTTNGSRLFWHKKDEPYLIIPGVILNDDGTATIKRS